MDCDETTTTPQEALRREAERAIALTGPDARGGTWGDWRRYSLDVVMCGVYLKAVRSFIRIVGDRQHVDPSELHDLANYALFAAHHLSEEQK